MSFFDKDRQSCKNCPHNKQCERDTIEENKRDAKLSKSIKSGNKPRVI